MLSTGGRGRVIPSTAAGTQPGKEKGKPVDLQEMRAERDRLNAAISEAERKERQNWNLALADLENSLEAWLREQAIDADDGERKNETTWDIGHGALSVTFGRDEEGRARSLRMVSGRTLTLEWSELPEPPRMLAIVAALLNR
jgi:hypothetical protein